jgi:hypothetical protein
MKYRREFKMLKKNLHKFFCSLQKAIGEIAVDAKPCCDNSFIPLPQVVRKFLMALHCVKNVLILNCFLTHNFFRAHSIISVTAASS